MNVSNRIRVMPILPINKDKKENPDKHKNEIINGGTKTMSEVSFKEILKEQIARNKKSRG